MSARSIDASLRCPAVARITIGLPPPGPGSVLVGSHHRPVDEMQQPVQLAPRVRIGLQHLKHPVPHALRRQR